MQSEDMFLQAIAAGDDTARLAFADWLEERGDRRAPWVRDPEVFPWLGEDARDPAPALMAALFDWDDWHHKESARQIVPRVSSAMVAPLLDVLEQQGDRAIQAGKLLGTCQPQDIAAIVPRLISFIENASHQYMALPAIEALAGAGPAAAAALPWLLRQVREEPRKGEYSDSMLRVFSAMGPAALPAAGRITRELQSYSNNEAITALCRIGPAAAPAILSALRWLNRDGVFVALKPLRSYGGKICPDLVAALESSRLETRLIAALLLMPYQPEAARPVLLDGLSDQISRSVRLKQNVGNADLLDTVTQLGPAVWPMLSLDLQVRLLTAEPGSNNALYPMRKALISAAVLLESLKIEELRDVALQAIPRLTVITQNLVMAVVLHLTGSSGQTREIAARVLGEIGRSDDAEVITALRTACKDKVARVREAAFMSLRKLAPNDLSPSAVKLAKDRSRSVRVEALQALGQSPDSSPKTLAVLLDAIQSPCAETRCAAACSLVRLSRPEGVEVLTQLMRSDPDVQVRRTATQATKPLEMPRQQKIVAFCRAFPESDRTLEGEKANILVELVIWERRKPDLQTAVVEFLHLLTTQNAWLVREANKQLQQLGVSAKPALEAVVGGQDPLLREMARQALAMLAFPGSS